MNKIFAITTRGLEAISADELDRLPGVTVQQIAYRRVFASCHSLLAPLLSLRTVDDIFLYVGTWQGMDRPRRTLSRLKEASAQLDLKAALAICEQIRPIRKPLLFSVTVNFVGKRNYSTEEIKQACAAGIIERHPWTYSEDDTQADLNVRLFLEGETVTAGVRLGARSLSRRAYKQEHVPGSLKPTVAAALVALADVFPGARLLDPCCGAGTILIEAGSYRVEALGGDFQPQAVAAAHFNAANANVSVLLQRWDARGLPISYQSVDRVISNLPWGRAVDTTVSLQTFYREISEEIERVLIPAGKAVLLTSLPDLVRFQRLKCERKLEISLFGQTPTIMVWGA